MPAVRCAALAAALAVAVAGCESTQDKAARVQKENAKRQKLASIPLTIPKIDSRIEVTGTTVLRGKEANAVVVSLRNSSGKALADIPIAVQVFSSKGRRIASNTDPGTDHWLNHVPLIRAGQTIDWVNDQFDPDGKAASAKVRVGVGRSLASPYPDAKLLKTHFFKDPISGTSFTGKARSSAPVTQERLVVYSVGRQGGRVVSAGRGVVERLKANGANRSTFTVFYVGADPKTVQLSNLAPPVRSPRK